MIVLGYISDRHLLGMHLFNIRLLLFQDLQLIILHGIDVRIDQVGGSPGRGTSHIVEVYQGVTLEDVAAVSVD